VFLSGRFHRLRSDSRRVGRWKGAGDADWVILGGFQVSARWSAAYSWHEEWQESHGIGRSGSA
jgi:hypothetical protein